MGTSQVKVNLVAGKATTDQNGSITLDKENDLEIQVGTGFNGSAQVSAMTLYHWDPNKGNGQGSEVGTWDRSDPVRQPSSDVALSADGNSIRVTDVDTVADARFCYTATVHDADGDHVTPDPELIVKKKKKG